MARARIGDGAAVVSLVAAVTDLGARLDRAEGGLRELGMMPCGRCGAWRKVQYLSDGSAHGLFALGSTWQCFDCFVSLFRAMADDDGPEWEAIPKDPEARRDYLRQLARVAGLFPRAGQLAEAAFAAVDDPELGLAWMAAKRWFATVYA